MKNSKILCGVPKIVVGVYISFLAVVFISFLILALIPSVFSWFITLPKTQVAHFYEKVCDARVIGEVSKRQVNITLLNELGEDLTTVSGFVGVQYTYKKSLVGDDGEYFPERSLMNLSIELFPDAVLMDSERTTLWRRVTVCKTDGQPDTEDVTGYFVGPLPAGAPVKHKLRQISDGYIPGSMKPTSFE